MRYIIFGTGNISKTYLNAIAAMPESAVVGFISRSPRVGELLQWKSLDQVDVEFDAVIIATPNGTHHQHIMAAASLGKHVITEKPLAVSLEHAQSAIAACEQAGVTLAVAYQHRTAPDNRALKKLFDQQAFGKVFAADLSAKFFRPQTYYDSAEYRGGWEVDGGGPFMQQACHNLDILTWFFGLPIKVVSMLDTFVHNIEAEDHGAALLHFRNGMIGTVVASTAAKPGYGARLEVHTEKGSFTLTDDKITQWDIADIANPSSGEFHYAHQGATSAVVTDTSAHQAIIRDFEQAVASESLPIANAYSACLTTQLIQQIYAANIVAG